MNLTEITAKIEKQSDKTEIFNDKALKKCQKDCDALNADIGDYNKADGYNCDICKNKGFVFFPKSYSDKYNICSRECKCMNKRRMLRHLKKSGLDSNKVLEELTFKKFIVKNLWQKNIKTTAKKFLESENCWLYTGGQSGCGKTHICTAICSEFLNQDKSVFYMLWVNESKNLKNTINDYEKHNELLDRCQKADVLYIDDFFKSGKDKDGKIQKPTSADIQLAYDILNFRYCNSKLIIIISSERLLNDILEIDEAIAGRIYERANKGEFVISIGKDSEKNQRIDF